MRKPGTVLQLRWFTLIGLMACALGCHTANKYHPNHAMDHSPPIYETMPKELSKVVLPEYVIEPPDILSIEGIHIIPKAPYSLRVLDVLNVQVFSELLPGDEIGGSYVVEPGGVITLGGRYGVVKVAGLTAEQAKEAIIARLSEHLDAPEASVVLGQISGAQNVTGQFLVGPDGTITLGSYGQVSVVGRTLNQAKAEVEAFLSQHLEDPVISMHVHAYNSKVYYIVLQGAGLGDGVYRLPITGNDTVLDAISQIQGLEQVSSKKIWVARPARTSGQVKILPVDYFAMTERGVTETNYQLLPGDRVFIAEDKLVAFDTSVAKFTAPLERIMGFTLLGTGTATRLSGPVLRGGGNPNNSGF